MKKGRIRTYFALHIMLMIYSLSGLCSKLAAGEKFLSLKFCLYYGFLITMLGFYAIGWQQIIKRLPLTVAFANRAVAVVWGIIWGFVFFSEAITLGKVIGATLIIFGVIMYAHADEEEKSNE